MWHGCNSLKRKERRSLSHFQWKHGISLDASVLSPRRVLRRIGEGRMGTILMIMAVPWLYATGIYNPQVMHHGHCIAQPGTL